MKPASIPRHLFSEERVNEFLGDLLTVCITSLSTSLVISITTSHPSYRNHCTFLSSRLFFSKLSLQDGRVRRQSSVRAVESLLQSLKYIQLSAICKVILNTISLPSLFLINCLQRTSNRPKMEVILHHTDGSCCINIARVIIPSKFTASLTWRA